MTILIFTLAMWLGALAAGLVGALTGLGGGVIIVPLLVLAFHVDMRYAIGASLVSVIATSSGAASAYVREGFTNIRLGMFLEVATTCGALSGALLAPHVPTRALAIIFGLVLLYSAYLSHHHAVPHGYLGPERRLSRVFQLDSSLPSPEGPIPYHVQNVEGGFSLMYVAGVLSGLLGIGSGAVKVLAMDRAMKLPFKVSTTTSNFMIGVTAAASAGVYLRRGYIDPGVAMPVVIGVLIGSLTGARILTGAKVDRLRMIFTWVIVGLAAEMLYSGLTGRMQ